MAVTFRAPVLAWAVSPDDEVRFKRILRCVLGGEPRRLLAALAAGDAARPINSRRNCRRGWRG